MGAADPTYPLFPVASIIASLLLLLVLLSSFVRQHWNLGVVFLCFWLFFENLTNSINAIIWSDNFDVRLYVYCDIVSHLQMIAFVAKPMSTLLITRRLYLIARPRLILWDRLFEWTLGLVIPVLVAGPIYYVSQSARFAVNEGFGCSESVALSAVSLISLRSWGTLPPLLSLALYHTMLLYKQRRELGRFLGCDAIMPLPIYFRFLAIATLDILMSLSVNVTNDIIILVQYLGGSENVLFYPGWHAIHDSPWHPTGTSWKEMEAGGSLSMAQTIYTQWTSPILSFAVFGCFGLTRGARASYWTVFWIITGWFGWNPTRSARRRGANQSVSSSFRFNRNTMPQDISLASCETRSLPRVVDIAPSLSGTSTESRTLDSDVSSEATQLKGPARFSDANTEDRKRRSSDLSTTSVDLGEVPHGDHDAASAV
ncbi:unnamed protein product [Peniophora sp. CBMAI 1063]|nr:unnamed protein product [Peniophora sp. CBMAI 1063]